MNKLNLSALLKDAKTAVVKHSPEILTGIGIAGMITTTVLAVKATPKAMRILEEEKRNREVDRANGVDEQFAPEKISVLDTIKLCWKPYIPAITTGVASTACLIGANSVNARRNAALATAYQLSTTAFSEYKEQVVEAIGEKKEQTIKEKVAKKKVEQNPPESRDIIITGNGHTLFCDATFGKYFESDYETVRKVVNDLNERMINGEEYVSLNDFYDELGTERIAIGDDLGWNIGKNGKIDVSFGTAMSKDNRPCITLQYEVAPRYDYHKLM